VEGAEHGLVIAWPGETVVRGGPGAVVPVVIEIGAVLMLVAACGGGGGSVSHPTAHATTAAPKSAAARAQVAAASVQTLAPLQEAVNTCVQAVTANIASQVNDGATSAALETLLGKKASDAVDIAKITDDTANNTVEISYELKNGQLDNATFDAGRMISALLGNIPEFKLFGIIGDPAIYCTEAAFWYTGQLGGQLGQLLRAKLQPPAAITSTIEGTWTLTRSAATICINFPAGCHDSPIKIRLGHCTDTKCAILRTGGVFAWQSAHPLVRNGAVWVADFQDIAIACHSQVNVAEITIRLSVTSTYMRNGALSARSLGGTYAVKAGANPPNCPSNGRGTYALHGSRS
jgi:hypothetical protein